MEPQNSTNEAAPIAQRPAGALSPTAKAQAVFERDFPAGFEIIHTSANGLLCGFAAVIKSMEEMHKSSPNLPIPTMKELQDVRTSPAFMDLIRNTGLTNSNQFTIDQVGGVLYFWGLARNLNLRVGCVVEGSPPQLLSHANEDPAHIVWVHNDNFEASDVEGAISHFSGMRRKRRSYGFPASQLSAMQRGQQTTKGEFSETDGGVTGRPKLTPVSRLNRSLRQNGSPAASQASNTTTTEQTVPGRAAIKQKLAFEAFVRRFLPQLRKAYKSKHGQITDRYDCLRFVRELFQEYQTVIEKREQDSISQVEVHVAPYDQYPEVPIAYRFGNYQRPGQLKTSEVKSEGRYQT